LFAVVGVATLILHGGAAQLLPVQPMAPDFDECRELGVNWLRHGHYGFDAEWLQRPDVKVVSWRYLYDSNGFLREPGMPLVAGVADLIGLPLRGLAWVDALLGVVSALAVAWTARRLFGNLTGLLAGLAVATSPALLDAVPKLGREPWLQAFLALGMAGIVDAGRTEKSLRPALFAGTVFAVAASFKMTTLVGGLLGLLWLGWLGWRKRRSATVRAAILAGVLGVSGTVPWLVRNAQQDPPFYGMSNMVGLGLSSGFSLDRWLREQPEPVRRALDPYTAPNSLEADKRLRTQFRLFARQHPERLIVEMAQNVGMFWSPAPRRVWATRSPTPLDAFATVYFVVFYGVALLGCWQFRRRREVWLVLIVVGTITALHAPVFTWPRYRWPYDILPLWFAAAWLAARLGARTAPTERA